MASVATMAALVLGLLVASTKSSYDAKRNELTQLRPRLITWTTCWLITDLRRKRAVPCSTASWSALVRIWPDEKSTTQPWTPAAPGLRRCRTQFRRYRRKRYATLIQVPGCAA